jgi:hypothetical protein
VHAAVSTVYPCRHARDFVVAHLLDVTEVRAHRREEWFELGLARKSCICLSGEPRSMRRMERAGSSLHRANSYARQCGDASSEARASLYADPKSMPHPPSTW